MSLGPLAHSTTIRAPLNSLPCSPLRASYIHRTRHTHTQNSTKNLKPSFLNTTSQKKHFEIYRTHVALLRAHKPFSPSTSSTIRPLLCGYHGNNHLQSTCRDLVWWQWALNRVVDTSEVVGIKWSQWACGSEGGGCACIESG